MYMPTIFEKNVNCYNLTNYLETYLPLMPTTWDLLENWNDCVLNETYQLDPGPYVSSSQL